MVQLSAMKLTKAPIWRSNLIYILRHKKNKSMPKKMQMGAVRKNIIAKYLKMALVKDGWPIKIRCEEYKSLSCLIFENLSKETIIL